MNAIRKAVEATDEVLDRPWRTRRIAMFGGMIGLFLSIAVALSMIVYCNVSGKQLQGETLLGTLCGVSGMAPAGYIVGKVYEGVKKNGVQQTADQEDI